MSVILECIEVKNKLRIRFKEYIDIDGKKFTNAYNNNYNCRFPKKDKIRQLGRCYKVPAENIKISNIQGKAPFYVVKDKDILILDEEKFDPEVVFVYIQKTFDAGDCVICLEEKSNRIFVPCGHKCVCDDCSLFFQNIEKTMNCPLCRREITHIIE